MIIVRNNIKSSRIDLQDMFSQSPLIDVIAVMIKLSKYSIYLFCIYIPPECDADQVELFFDNLINWSAIWNVKLFIAGDFNCPYYYNYAQGLPVTPSRNL